MDLPTSVPATPVLVTVGLYIVGQVGRTFRAWIVARRRHEELTKLATVAAEQAASANRKLLDLREHLEGKGFLTPDFARPPRRSPGDAVTYVGPIPPIPKPPDKP